MITSLHVADATRSAAARVLASQRRLRRLDGVRTAHVTIGGPLGPTPGPRPHRLRIVTIVEWRSHDDFERTTEGTGHLASGWCALLQPVRGTGPWPTDASPTARDPLDVGPAAVITVGDLRLRHARSFLRHAGRVGAQLKDAPGVRWATAIARPPFVGTCSLWDSDADLYRFAYRKEHGEAHLVAMAADRRTPFHVDPSFVRFRIIACRGEVPDAAAITPHRG